MTMQPSALLEAALYVRDLDEAERFYGGTLGLKRIAKAEGRHVFFQCGSCVVLLFNAEATKTPPEPGANLPVPPHGAHGEGHLCFAATGEEIARWRAHLENAGIAIEADFEWPNGGRSIYFRDPSGNSLEFAEPRIWGLTSRN
ncbi:glyoxalase/bleomycin resistance protein/dioxygenase [Nitratireductor pacificus pht-3B]|uniref:Glyoxalase/bleomycin resistance protein/dioxygenase n=2 Tax=Nitratireductor TaxID=245876 RepID=K2MRT5_9HYPH|nr:glyoxalase/bleomycin resistance protein/dioxygenase [Nitratireductor pacificus pht-3B]